MLDGFKDKSAVALCTFAFHSGKEGDKVRLFRGEVKGDIVEPRGDNAFGWDPIFQPKDWKKTFAEMDVSEKHQISHRRRAIDALRKYFTEEREEEEEEEEEEVKEVPKKTPTKEISLPTKRKIGESADDTNGVSPHAKKGKSC
ncbi:UNVERIFIED_CONTAM: hypothetical protein GTU68_013831 [Idotea baltica]|nr:hypothetical protein [Idotea baltica]